MPFLPYLSKTARGAKNGRIAAAHLLLLTLALGACSWVPSVLTEYKIDIQQGNVLTQDMVSQLKPGLSRDQVRFILGTPVLMDMFHGNRWDYLYRLQKGTTGEIEERKFSVFFEDDRLLRVAGDVEALSPSEASSEPRNRMREIDLGSVPEGTEAPPVGETGFFGRMMEKLGF